MRSPRKAAEPDVARSDVARSEVEALQLHRDAASDADGEAKRLRRRGQRMSLARLVTFVAAVVCFSAGLSSLGRLTPEGTAESEPAALFIAMFARPALWMLCLAALMLAAFVGLVVAHARLDMRARKAEVRRRVHRDAVARITDAWQALPVSTTRHVLDDHPYASDLDVAGPGSLLHRIDVTQTRLGEETLAGWLGSSAPTALRLARQAAVAELGVDWRFRAEVEILGRLSREAGLPTVPASDATPGSQPDSPKLDERPLLSLAAHQDEAPRSSSASQAGTSFRPPWLLVLLPTGLLLLLVAFGMFPAWSLLCALPLHLLASAKHGALVAARFEILGARRGGLESFAALLSHIEGASLSAPHLQALQACLRVEGEAPAQHLRAADRLAGYAEIRHQVLFHVPLHLLTLWDLWVLWGIERWMRRVGNSLAPMFAAVAELEALCSLAVLAQPGMRFCFPSDASVDEATCGGVHAEALLHPLLPAEGAVVNPLSIAGPGHALLVTGSNMAGKSTYLRTVGLNIALGLAGGPVLATSMRLPRVRLRSSMRALDSLQSGSSYFHAELRQIKKVIRSLRPPASTGSGPPGLAAPEACPLAADDTSSLPVFFLLDELLRGTNEAARHIGARAIVEHLLAHGAMGIVATHDTALATLEAQHEGRVNNAHFTDVFEEGVMRFDYQLRPGVVQSSNALRLLEEAGIPLPAQVASSSL